MIVLDLLKWHAICFNLETSGIFKLPSNRTGEFEKFFGCKTSRENGSVDWQEEDESRIPMPQIKIHFNAEADETAFVLKYL